MQLATDSEIEEYADLQHTGPGTLAGRFMRSFWQPVYRAQDLKPGRAVPIRIMSEDFTLYRGETGTSGTPTTTDGPSTSEPANPANGGAAHLVAFRCAHRGTQLSVGWVEGECIRCRYHGWKYDESGQCVEQPGEEASFASRVRLRAYSTQEYLGLVWAYLGEGTPPEMPRYPEFEDPGVLDVYPPEYWPCNYFNRIDNAADLAHIHYAHRDSREAAATRTGVDTVIAEETEYGVRTTMSVPGAAQPTVHFHMPNLNQFISQGDLKLRDRFNSAANGPSAKGTLGRLLIRVPIDDERCVSFPIDHVSLTGEVGEEYLARRRRLEEAQLAAPESPEDMGEAALASRMLVSDVIARDQANLKTLTSVEDYVVQVGQGSIADHGAERLGRVDAGLRLIRTLWERELRALAEGRATKAWRRNGRLEDR